MEEFPESKVVISPCRIETYSPIDLSDSQVINVWVNEWADLQ